MKKLFALLTIALTVAISDSSAQVAGQWKFGAMTSIYSRWDGAAAIGAYGRYGFGNHLRIEPSFLIYCRKGMSVDISGDVQYPIALNNGFELYPLAGISINDPGKLGVGLNLGSGLGYNIDNKFSLDCGLKWRLQSQKYIRNPVIFSFGAGYRF